MRILLLGATGRTGKLVLQTAIRNGHDVNCLARHSKRIEECPGLSIFEGNPINRIDLTQAISTCDAVISTLNISRTTDFPWSRLRTPTHFMSDVMSLLIPIAEKQNIKRVIVCSAWGVSDTKNQIPTWFKWLIDNSNIGFAYRDHERQERIIMESKLDWTIVRPSGLTNSKRQEKVKESFDNSIKPNLLVSRCTVAKYLVDSLENTDLIRRTVAISKV